MVSQQLKSAPHSGKVHAETLIESAAPSSAPGRSAMVHRSRGLRLSRALSRTTRLRHQPDCPPTRQHVDHSGAIPAGLSEALLGRMVDLVTYGGLKPGIHDDALRGVVQLSWTGVPGRSSFTCATSEKPSMILGGTHREPVRGTARSTSTFAPSLCASMRSTGVSAAE